MTFTVLVASFPLPADCNRVDWTPSSLPHEFQATLPTQWPAVTCFFSIISAYPSFQAWRASGHITLAIIRRRILISKYQQLHVISAENLSHTELLLLHIIALDGRLIFVFQFFCNFLPFIAFFRHSTQTILVIPLENLFGYENIGQNNQRALY